MSLRRRSVDGIDRYRNTWYPAPSSIMSRAASFSRLSAASCVESSSSITASTLKALSQMTKSARNRLNALRVPCALAYRRAENATSASTMYSGSASTKRKYSGCAPFPMTARVGFGCSTLFQSPSPLGFAAFLLLCRIVATIPARAISANNHHQVFNMPYSPL